MATKRRMREFQRCLRNIKSFSDNQAQITEWDEDCLDWVIVVIQPKENYYYGGKFTFKIIFENDYPQCQPRVDCLTPIYHPNIDPTSDEYNVCLNLFDEWESKFGLEDIIQGLLFLMYNPNIEDPLSPYFSPQMDEQEMIDNITSSLEGKALDDAPDMEFPVNNDSEEVNEEALSRGIDRILEKASAMVLHEEDEETNSDSESVVDMNTLNACADVTEPQVTEDTLQILLRQESKVDKLDSPTVIHDCDTMSVAGIVSSDEDAEGFALAKYIPPTFITPQPDFLVTAVMMGLDMVVAKC